MYLWHWPLFTFARFAETGLTLNATEKVILFGLTIVLSYLSWAFVEQPFRRRIVLPTQRLAFVAALQYLPPRQRAVLLLRDVLQWRSAEVAEAVGTTTTAVNSLLQRARSQLDAVGPSADDQLARPDSPEAQDLLARYIAAFETYDIDRLVELFTAEAIWEMPPYLGWYQGAADIVTLIHQQCPAESGGDMRLLPLVANGQLGAAMYMRAGDMHVPFQLHVLDVHGEKVSHVVAFLDDTLFTKFGLPSSLPAGHR